MKGSSNAHIGGQTLVGENGSIATLPPSLALKTVPQPHVILYLFQRL